MDDDEEYDADEYDADNDVLLIVVVGYINYRTALFVVRILENRSKLLGYYITSSTKEFIIYFNSEQQNSTEAEETHTYYMC